MKNLSHKEAVKHFHHHATLSHDKAGERTHDAREAVRNHERLDRGHELTKQEILKGDYRTKASEAHTPREKEMYKRATAIAVKETGRRTEHTIPYGVVQRIFEDEIKGNKVITKKDIKRTGYDKKLAKRYK